MYCEFEILGVFTHNYYSTNSETTKLRLIFFTLRIIQADCLVIPVALSSSREFEASEAKVRLMASRATKRASGQVLASFISEPDWV